MRAPKPQDDGIRSDPARKFKCLLDSLNDELNIVKAAYLGLVLGKSLQETLSAQWTPNINRKASKNSVRNGRLPESESRHSV